MYKPSYSVIESRELALELVKEFPFGLLVSTHAGKIEANYLPFLIVEENHEMILLSHLAKANSHWTRFDGEVLVSFQGPNRYISPTIYINKLNVPTWSYATVQIRGTVEIVSDRDGLKDILSRTVHFFEEANTTSWSYELPMQMQHSLEAAIVGIKIRIVNLESKFKLSQNRNKEDYQAVVDHFRESMDPKDRELHKWMVKTKT